MGVVCNISIVIPVYREADRINPLIDGLRRLDTTGKTEVVVVDGDPERSTIAAIEDRGVVTLGSSKSRARQMNAGAAVAHGDVLLFLHADTLLPAEGLHRIAEVMSSGDYVGGAFGVTFDSDHPFLRVLGHIASIRPRVTRIPYGDNAIFIHRDYFRRMGGYKDMPIMEDIDLMRRVRARGGRICVLGDRVLASARRFEERGCFNSALRGTALLLLYALGVSPHRLKPHYADDFRPPRPVEDRQRTAAGGK